MHGRNMVKSRPSDANGIARLFMLRYSLQYSESPKTRLTCETDDEKIAFECRRFFDQRARLCRNPLSGKNRTNPALLPRSRNSLARCVPNCLFLQDFAQKEEKSFPG
jgi:hypothetical protein